MEKTSSLNCQTTAAKVCFVRKEMGVDSHHGSVQVRIFTLTMRLKVHSQWITRGLMG